MHMHSKQSDVRNGIQILHSLLAMYSQPLLSGALKTGVISLDLRPKCVDFLESHAFTVDGKTIIIRKRHVFCASTAFPSVVQFL